MAEKKVTPEIIETTKQKTVIKKEKPVQVYKEPVHVEQFLGTAKYLYEMDSMQENGFKGFMQGQQYQPTEKDFVPYLEKYLGKGDK